MALVLCKYFLIAILRCFRIQSFEGKKFNQILYMPGSKLLLSCDKCRGLNLSIKVVVFQSHHRNYTKRSKFHRKVQPSTLDSDKKSFRSWHNIGWTPTKGVWLISPPQIPGLWNNLIHTLHPRLPRLFPSQNRLN